MRWPLSTSFLGWQPIPFGLLLRVGCLWPTWPIMLFILSTPYPCDLLDGWAWLHQHHNWNFSPFLSSCLSSWGTPWELAQQKHDTWLVLDPTYPTIVIDSFPLYDWTGFYGDVMEAIPHDMNVPFLGKDLNVRMMCNSDHAGDKRTRCSHTGFLIWLRPQSLVPSSLWWSTSNWEVEGTAVKLHMMGMYPWQDPLIFMVTTNHKLPTRLDLSQLWKRNAFFLSCLGNQWRWVNPWSPTFALDDDDDDNDDDDGDDDDDDDDNNLNKLSMFLCPTRKLLR